MSEIIDVLTILPQEAPYFTVDLTPGTLSVPLYVYDGSTYCIMHRGGGAWKFQYKDNFTVLSAGFYLPESFAMASPPDSDYQACMSLALYLMKPDGSASSITTQFGLGGIQLPLENYEMPVGIYVDLAKDCGLPLITTAFGIMGVIKGIDDDVPARPRISMVGVPSALDETVQRLTVFIKVVHNLPLLTGTPPIPPNEPE